MGNVRDESAVHLKSHKPESWGPVFGNSNSTTGWNAPTKGTAKLPQQSPKRAYTKHAKSYVLSGVPELAQTPVITDVAYRPGAGMTGAPNLALRNIPSATKRKRTRAVRSAQSAAARVARAAEREAARMAEAERLASVIASGAEEHAVVLRARAEVERVKVAQEASRPAVPTLLSQGEAAVLYPAAMGAVRCAEDAGNSVLAESLRVRARAYRQASRRGSNSIAPSMQRVKDMATVYVADVSDVQRAIVAELDAAGKLTSWTVAGVRDDRGDVKRLYVRRSGKSIVYREA